MHHNLLLETFADQNAVRLRLEDENSIQIACQEICLTDHPASSWEGVFDTRRHVNRYEGSLLWENATDPETEEQILTRLGLFVGKQVLGEGDDYARELARQFFRHLLADPGKHSTEGVLALARSDLLSDKRQAAVFGSVNYATPLLFGAPGRIPEPADRRSDQMKRQNPFPRPLLPGNRHELDAPEDFAGRSMELTELNTRWLPDNSPPLALIQGLAGMGKTVLTAEAIHLWHTRFDYVLAFQAKPAALGMDEMLPQVDGKLIQFSPPYAEKCSERPMLRVYLSPDPRLTPQQRYDRMRQNLLEAMRDENILLVLDNFETNLSNLTPGPFPEGKGSDQPANSPPSLQGRGAGGLGFPCLDPQWDQLLTFLSRELKDTRSRVLVTSRHLPAALAENDDVPPVLLGPLSYAERGLYLRSHPALRDLLYGDAEGKELALKLLKVSRGHPLIMNRLAGLAGNRSALAEAMEALESKGHSALLDLFAPMSEKDKETERRYLEDAAVGSVDFLIHRLFPQARTLLWMMTQANEPVSEDLIQGVWSELLITQESKPAEFLLQELARSGLVNRESNENISVYSFHELVRERMAAWMEKHQHERGGKTAEQVWVAYGERYAAIFEKMYYVSRDTAGEAGRRALVYFVRAKAYDKLGVLASTLPADATESLIQRPEKRQKFLLFR